MRKCKVITNIKTVRTDDELLVLWEALLSKRGMIHEVDINTDSHGRRQFFNSNREYFNKIEVDGLFHQWGSDFKEFDAGPGNYTVAIVELPDGSIVTPDADKIIFIQEDKDGTETVI